MFRLVLVGAVLVACSSPHGTSDAAGDDACTGDRDGDGICDAVDVCPDVPDPAQFDLDGDGIGWMCDPLESTTISLTSFQGWIHGDTFASTIVTGCTSEFVCNYAVLIANANGKLFARGDSGRPEDAWMASTAIGGPYVTPDEQFLFSREFQFDVQRVDLATGTAAKVLDGYFETPTAFGGAHVLFPERVSAANENEDLLVPESGQLAKVGSTTELAQALDPPLAHTPSATYAIYSTAGGKGSLATYTLGDASTATVSVGGIPVVDLTKLVLLGDTTTGELPLCIDQGTGASYVGLRAGGATATLLPSDFAQCIAVAARLGSSWFLRGASPTANTATIGLVRDGVVTIPPLLSQFPNTTLWNVVGDQIPVVQLVTGAISKYVAIAPDGTAVLLHAALHDAVVSTRGDTVHVVGTDGSNALVLVRYRPGTGVQQVTLAATGFPMPEVVTTREGGVVVGNLGFLSAVPSTSMTRTDFAVESPGGGGAGGGVVGDYTLIRGSTQLGQPVLAVYQETGGVPTLTQVAQADVTLFGESPWFTYFGGAVSCGISRVVIDGTGQPTLDTPIPCHAWNAITPIGVRANGDTIVRDDNGSPSAGALFVISGDTVTKVVSSTDRLQVIADDSGVIVGWIGTDATGAFACLASHPDRCWTIPDLQTTDSAILYRWANASDGGGDGRFAVVGYVDPESKLYIFRSLGTGDRPPPL